VAEEEVEPLLLSVESAPLRSEDEPGGLSSLSVDKGGPKMGGDEARLACRRRRWPEEGTAFGRRRSAAFWDHGRAGHAAGEAAIVKASPIPATPPVRGRSSDVPDPASGGAGTPALGGPTEGHWAAARSEATDAPRPGTGVPSDAAVAASSAASGNT